MTEEAIRSLLAEVADNRTSIDDAIQQLRALPFEDLGFAKVDHHRAIRHGCPEVIYCQGKTPEQVAEICLKLARNGPRLLGTRASREHFEAAQQRLPDLQYDPVARVIWMDRQADEQRKPGIIIIAAGTSDLPVAEEAAMTLRIMGHEPTRLYDVGVAGLHRLLHHLPDIQQANVIIVVAGMEGALPSVVAGLVAAPVIAVPTSVGYGASFGGIAALLGMLNTCASGLAVVNIDNGYGAGHMAAIINHRTHHAAEHRIIHQHQAQHSGNGNGR